MEIDPKPIVSGVNSEMRASIGASIEQILAILDSHSSKEAASILKMVAANYNLKTESVFRQQQGPLGSVVPRSVGNQQSVRGKGNQPKAENTIPEVLLLKKRLASLRSRIKDAAAQEVSGTLPDTDPLIIEQGEILAAILAAKSSFRGSKSQSEKKPSTSVSEGKKAQEKV
jgi:hypothetical protein